MKRLMVVTALVAIAALPLGCGKASGDRAARPASRSADASGQETAWKLGADAGATGAQSAEVQPAPNVEQPPSGLPMASEDLGMRARGGASIQTDLKAQ